MIIVMHRARSEKLARRFVEAMGEQNPNIESWSELPAEEQEGIIASFDSLIQDGLIGKGQPRPEGRE